jgi:hypothetical protein
MQKSITKTITLFLLLAMVLSACQLGGSGDETPPVSESDLVLTEAAKIADESMTETAAAIPPSPTPLPVTDTATPTLEPVTNPTEDSIPTNASELTQGPVITSSGASPTPLISQATPTRGQQAPSGDLSCYKASFESEGPPFDGDEWAGGKTFTKTWRIKNIGTCTWTSEVYLKWITTTVIENGVEVEEVAQLFGQLSAIPIIVEDVPPGGHLDIAIEFEVPNVTKITTFKVYWMLGSPAGVFGINGGSIWFIIRVLPPE